ncbi:GGDEF domain-containing protein [Vibrio europaeus]|uniref:GGDEF domain-containing protein n=1 Tax=Vibrio europaeus TaxID=300876 RepID=UPI00233F5BEC|nr:diguanylate cyclase [Vibrio europaeus]MDC5853925.1 diguanylate cyclase [Vibrio europaeus]
MKRLIAWYIAFAALAPISALAIDTNHLGKWEVAYSEALKVSENKALSMLQDRYNSLPPNIEKLYISSKLHSFMTQRGQPYYGNELVFNPEYSKLEQTFIEALNKELNLDFSTARSNYLDLLKHFSTTNNLQGKILFEYHLCRAMNMQGQYYSAQLYCNALETHIKDTEHSILPKHLALRVIANNQEFTGDYKSSLETYQSYLAVIPSYVDPSGVYNDAGLLLKTLGQFDLAKEYLTISLRLRSATKSPLKLAQSHHSMGDILLASQEYHGAVEHFKRSKLLLDKFNHAYGITFVKLGLGKAYTALKQFELAEHFLLDSLNSAETQNNEQIQGEIYLALSQLDNAKGGYNSALYFAQSANDLATKIGSEQLQARALRTMAQLEEANGNYAVALKHYQHYFDSELSKRTKSSRSAFLALELAQKEFNQKVKDNKSVEIIESLELEVAKLLSQRQMFLLLIILLIATIIGQFFFTRTKSRKAEMDQLTGALNRAAAIKRIRAFDRASAQIRKHILILLDLDDFKHINDSYGHPTGDRALATIAKGISEAINEEDVLGRLGGEEFVIVLRNVDELDVRDRVENLHQIIAKSIFEAENREKLNVTASFSYLATSKPLHDFDELYSILDQALYQVKQNGKNQIIDAYNEPIYLPSSAYVPVQP